MSETCSTLPAIDQSDLSGLMPSGRLFPPAVDVLSTPNNFWEANDLGAMTLGCAVVDVVEARDGGQNEMTASTHSLEKISEKPIFSLTNNGRKTNFTTLRNFAPKVEGTSEIYVVPSHLQDMMKDDSSAVTYETTVKEARWQEKLFDFTQDFLTHDPRGKVLAEGLEVTSLTNLTPEQAIKLSLGMVQLLSKYSTDVSAGGKAADGSTALQLLYQAKMRGRDPNWEGNGICRNIASNVKAVFEALKDGQPEESMLKNTYAVVTGGDYGRTYRPRTRENPDGFYAEDRVQQVGHAWNTFITIGKNGDSVVTIVDATWAAGDHRPDYTIERAYEAARKLYKTADDKNAAAIEITNYLDKYVSEARPENGGLLERRRFALTEYLKYADDMLAADDKKAITPRFNIYGAAYTLRRELDKKEVSTLFKLALVMDRLEEYDHQIAGVLDAYIERAGDDYEALLFSNDDLQRAMFTRIDNDKRNRFLMQSKWRGDLFYKLYHRTMFAKST